MDLIRGQLPGPAGVLGASRDVAAHACDLSKQRLPPWGRQFLAGISDGRRATACSRREYTLGDSRYESFLQICFVPSTHSIFFYQVWISGLPHCSLSAMARRGTARSVALAVVGMGGEL